MFSAVPSHYLWLSAENMASSLSFFLSSCFDAWHLLSLGWKVCKKTAKKGVSFHQQTHYHSIWKTSLMDNLLNYIFKLAEHRGHRILDNTNDYLFLNERRSQSEICIQSLKLLSPTCPKLTGFQHNNPAWSVCREFHRFTVSRNINGHKQSRIC